MYDPRSARVSPTWFPIRTDRLLLREFRSEDDADVNEYAGDVAVCRYMDWGPNDRALTRQIVDDRLRAQRCWPRREVDLAIELVAKAKLIGSISLRAEDPPAQVASFGYVVSRTYWNHGYATEAARALLRVAFEQLGMHRVWATCDARNVASSRVMEKLGMRREAEFRKDVLQKGRWRDSFLYAMLKSECPTY